MNATGTTVLLVERDLNRRERFYDLLTQHDYTVLTTVSTGEALEWLKHDRPHLILLGTGHAETNPVAWIEQIRSFDSVTPIILSYSQSCASPSVPTFRPEAVQAVLFGETPDHEILQTIRGCLSTTTNGRHEQWPGHILVVDDEPRLRQILGDFLTLRGFQVRTAASGDEALAALAQQVPTTILLDIHMPGMDGLLALKKIKLLHPSANVIMITGLDEERALEEALALGATDYIMKPFNFEYLETVLLSKLVLGKKS